MDKQLHHLQQNLEAAVQRADTDGIEFWFARDLQTPLGYARWENFQTAINRAIDSCEASGHGASDHFCGVTKMVELGSGSQRNIDDFMLTLFNCPKWRPS
jgi:DNA-damage-inducible protein D